jgi:hypothetical protein
MSQKRKLRKAVEGKAPVFDLPNATGERGFFVAVMNATGKAMVERGVQPDGCLRSLLLVACNVADECKLDMAATLAWAQHMIEQKHEGDGALH